MQKEKFFSLIDEVIKNRISDVHLGSNEPPYIRNKTGDMAAVENYGTISDEEMHEIAALFLEKPFTDLTNDTSFAYGGERFRVNISRTISGMTIAMRLIPSHIPEPQEIMLPNSLLEVSKANK